MAKRVLVIDDVAAVRRAFEGALGGMGYEVVTAASGQEGIMAFDQYRPALVFLDRHMPGLDGVEVLRAIRERDREVPVYMVTAFCREFFQELRAAAREGLEFELVRAPDGLDHLVEIARATRIGMMEAR